MDTLYQATLAIMESAFNSLAAQVPKPVLKKIGDGYVFRYAQQEIYRALIQKLARLVSGLYAAKHLLKGGFLQEQGALHRMLDEFREDIFFLAYGIMDDSISDLHKKYLEWFYQEEFDVPDNPLASTQKRGMIPRKKIRAYIARIEGPALSPSEQVELSRTVDKAYSGFVHGSSPCIMEMYGGDPPRFHLAGMLGTPLMKAYHDDLWNYIYRGILSLIAAAQAFGDEETVNTLLSLRDEFEKLSGANHAAPAPKQA